MCVGQPFMCISNISLLPSLARVHVRVEQAYTHHYIPLPTSDLLITPLFSQVRELLTYLPQSNADPAPIRETTDPADRLIPSLDIAVPKEADVPCVPRQIAQLCVPVRSCTRSLF